MSETSVLENEIKRAIADESSAASETLGAVIRAYLYREVVTELQKQNKN